MPFYSIKNCNHTIYVDSHLDTITHNTNRSSRNIKLYTYILFTRHFITNGSIKLKINKLNK